ncbi:MAG: glucose-6-phosphate isomerase, partial [Flavobacteriaceae bacterium]
MSHFPKINPTHTEAWKKLAAHYLALKEAKMQDFFSGEPSRAAHFSIPWEDFLVDYSKNRITQETLALLLQLAEEVQLKAAIEAQFEGAPINETEHRAVGHTQLRNFDQLPKEVSEALQKMKSFSQEVISGNWKGYTGKPITHIVNIGIGGSDLG